VLWRRCGDKQPKFVANCQVNGDNGNSIAVKGMGRNEAMAKSKAFAHLAQRCAKVKDRFGRCDQSVAQCSVTSF